MKTVIYKGKEIQLIKVNMEWENKSYWVWTIDNNGGDDLYLLQRNALNSAKNFIDNI
jgi:hypothetical protein